MLKQVIASFQRIYPGVTFSLEYVPMDDLLNTYQEDTYLGYGPSLLLGPASWGPGLYNQQLVTDLNPFVPKDFLDKINPAALGSGQYKGALISLPLSQHGTVMFRNTSIITSAPMTFDELESFSLQATHAGIVGSYLERGSFFSAADIMGLGGSLLDQDGYPTFNDSFGLEWLSLLKDYDLAGAVTFNTNRDLDMFKRGKVGIIIDGTWNTGMLASAIGQDNLAIDPWPSYGTGHLSGFVQADSVYLNPNTTGGDQLASLTFMGYLLDPNVQKMLAEVGHIPSVTAAQPRDPLLQQAMAAFAGGVAYPVNVDDTTLKLYWSELDKVIQQVLINGGDPATALKAASENITVILDNSPNKP